MKKIDLYKKAIELWGADSQIKLAIEECAELIVKLAKLGRNINGVKFGEICSEIADVEIMIEQLRIIFCSERIDEIKEQKLKRLEMRVKNCHT